MLVKKVRYTLVDSVGQYEYVSETRDLRSVLKKEQVLTMEYEKGKCLFYILGLVYFQATARKILN